MDPVQPAAARSPLNGVVGQADRAKLLNRQDSVLAIGGFANSTVGCGGFLFYVTDKSPRPMGSPLDTRPGLPRLGSLRVR